MIYKRDKLKNTREADHEIIHQENKLVHDGDTITDALSTMLLELVEE